MDVKEASSNQITSKEILEEAYKQKESKFSRPQQTIQDLDELQSFQQAKRKEYEQQLNKNRLNYGEWLRYARWEVQHNRDFPRARSIMERALDVNNQHIPFWIRYIQLELSYKNVNHARNLLDRAVKILPTVNKLWFLYVQTEESLKNYQMVRNVFEQWLRWHPDPPAWDAYISFESRYEEYDNVKNIFIRYIQEYPQANTWNKWVDFELANSPENINSIRAIFESAVDTLLLRINGDEEYNIELPIIISKWVDWEASCNEFDRAKEIYELLIGDKIKLPSKFRDSINESYTQFEKQYGTKESIQSSTVLKRKERYESDVKQDPTDYDSWWKYITILQSSSSIRTTTIQEVFKNALSNVPQDKYKSIKWRRYIMLWIRYALWEELQNNDIEAARVIWENCLKVIPHKSFTFGKVWQGVCEFELRNNNTGDNLTKARKILGRAIGQTSNIKPKRNLFNYYINFESRLGEWDRIRLLFEKWLEVALTTSNSCVDIVKQYVEFEQSLGEYQRCESILSSCLDLSNNTTVEASFQPSESFFRFCVEFFKDEMKYDEIRKMYRDLIEKSPTASNWISFALFESTIPSEEQLEQYLQSEEENESFEITITSEQIENTRSIFEEAEKYFKQNEYNEDRLVIIEAWKDYEQVHGDQESFTRVSNKVPTIVKKTRNVDGIEEEYLDYIFPQDKSDNVSISINAFLANAKKWAQQTSQ
ncbi:Pre-mRNA-splicing factor CLF1 [Spathaspora sp. JA1]|nr:Pre-mRNA-splicing factor CLF1 [Spathaspora sp. JA1]